MRFSGQISTPKTPQVCATGIIPAHYGKEGVNGITSDDTDTQCLSNPDNIVVSNVAVKPKTTYTTQSQKSIQYTVSYNLTNYNYDNNDKVIPIVYTIDGRIVKTEEIPVESLNTMKISRLLPPVSVGLGQHIVQVEANPKRQVKGFIRF